VSTAIKHPTKTTLALAVAALLPLYAEADASTDARIQALERELQALKQQLQVQSRVVGNQGKEIQSLAFPANDHILNKGDGKSLKFVSVDEKFQFQVGGRLQADAAFYDGDDNGFNNEFGDGTKIRRLFLDVRGVIDRDWNYRFQYDFARPAGGDSGARGIRDAWLQYTGWGLNQITVGNFKEYFGLEHLTSGLYTTFIERGVTDDLFTPDRHLGVGIGTYRPNWTANIGLFGERAEGDAANEGDEGWDLTGRYTYAPVALAGKVVHLGVAARYHQPNDSTTELRFRARPESNVTDVRLIDTNVLAGVDNTLGIGLEGAVVSGPFSVQGEYITTSVKRDDALDDVDLNAWYVYGSWFLTGESRPYRTKEAVFDRITPLTPVGKGDGLGGAWEVALRYSNADLNDGALVGGEQDNLTLGLNWYATKNLRFAANYIHVLDVDRPGNRYDGQELDTLLFRAQVDF